MKVTPRSIALRTRSAPASSSGIGSKNRPPPPRPRMLTGTPVLPNIGVGIAGAAPSWTPSRAVNEATAAAYGTSAALPMNVRRVIGSMNRSSRGSVVRLRDSRCRQGLVDFPAPHDEHHAPQGRDVLERIAVNGD